MHAHHTPQNEEMHFHLAIYPTTGVTYAQPATDTDRPLASKLLSLVTHNKPACCCCAAVKRFDSSF